jgi:hypothetical protein
MVRIYNSSVPCVIPYNISPPHAELRNKDSYHLWFSVELPYEELGLS